MLEAEKQAELRVPSHGAGLIMPPWTPERASAAGKRSAEVRKGVKWSWEGAALRALRQRMPDGERTSTGIVRALVMKGLEGDVKAVELLARLSGWTETKVRKVEHSLQRELTVRASDDVQPRIIDASASPVALMHSSATPVPSDQWTDGTDGEQASP